jgi:radical SAM superfamily enzyme YgiQ (UPF0313 family)
MRVLLISTYDLGHQPFGLASPAAWLTRDGAEVDALDLAVEPFDEERVRRAEVIGFHLPMHTATRLAAGWIPRVRELAPGATLCAYGLYAGMNAGWLLEQGVHWVIGGEFEAELAARVRSLARAPASAGGTVDSPERPRVAVSFDRLAFLPPDRSALPPLTRYAGLRLPDGTRRVAGATEATRGCKHRCRHCPIVPVYGGRFRVIPHEVVLEDVARQVEAGAEHVTFGDPDFWNGIGHAMPLVERLHRAHPRLTYDVTIKIEHLLRHQQHLPALVRTGCVLVTSAVESVDDAVLARLAKGHTRADFVRAVALCRGAGLGLQPTFLPFTPWITGPGYRDLLDAIEDLELVESVAPAPVQLAIRLLIPAGSRLLELDEVARLAGPFDPALLVHPWRHPDPGMDDLQRRVHAAVHRAGQEGASRSATFDAIRALASASEGSGGIETGETHARSRNTGDRARVLVPYLEEPWYC